MKDFCLEKPQQKLSLNKQIYLKQREREEENSLFLYRNSFYLSILTFHISVLSFFCLTIMIHFYKMS